MIKFSFRNQALKLDSGFFWDTLYRIYLPSVTSCAKGPYNSTLAKHRCILSAHALERLAMLDSLAITVDNYSLRTHTPMTLLLLYGKKGKEG